MKTLAGHTPQKFTTHTLEHNHLKKALYTYTNTPPGLVQPYAQPTTPTHHPTPHPHYPPPSSTATSPTSSTSDNTSQHTPHGRGHGSVMSLPQLTVATQNCGGARGEFHRRQGPKLAMIRKLTKRNTDFSPI